MLAVYHYIIIMQAMYVNFKTHKLTHRMLEYLLPTDFLERASYKWVNKWIPGNKISISKTKNLGLSLPNDVFTIY